jgi:hypothetical protein
MALHSSFAVCVWLLSLKFLSDRRRKADQLSSADLNGRTWLELGALDQTRFSGLSKPSLMHYQLLKLCAQLSKLCLDRIDPGVAGVRSFWVGIIWVWSCRV